VESELQHKLIFVGLGNPGKRYAYTRHNLGFLVVEALAQSLGWSWLEDKKYKAKVTKGVVNHRTVEMLMPLTYMNVSGWSLKQYLDYYKLSPQQVVVVYDDTSLPFGQLRVRSQGSAGGHNGMKSIIASLGTDEFTRLRMGIGSNAEGQPLADYVLSGFTIEETVALDEFVKRGAAVLKSLAVDTVAQVMNQVNTKLTL